MFGYVKPLNAELRMREYDCYRAYYCGLCRSMGECTGQCSRMTLSYDIVFLAAVRCYLAGEKPQFKKIRCILHPIRRRRAVVNSPQLAYCAHVSALLAYGKCRDDVADESGVRRLRARLGMLWMVSAYRRSARLYPELDRQISNHLSRLQALEATAEPNADEASMIFGDLMKDIFSEGLEGFPARIAAEIGYAVGRWVYLIDAADDLSEDRKKHRFNPYARILGAPPTAEDAESIRRALNLILTRAEQAYELMDEPPTPELREIIGNILFFGLPHTASKILKKEFPSQEPPKEQNHD